LVARNLPVIRTFLEIQYGGRPNLEFLPRIDAMNKRGLRGLCRHTMSVRLSVTLIDAFRFVSRDMDSHTVKYDKIGCQKVDKIASRSADKKQGDHSQE